MANLKRDVQEFLGNMVIVSLSSTVAKTITAPMDRIKLILQNQDSALQVLKGERPKYKGIIDCFLRFPMEQGFLSFWRGNGTNVLRYFPTQALNFALNDVFKNNLRKVIEEDAPSKSVLIKFISGGLAGTCAASVCFPLDFCQTKIAVDVGTDPSGKTDNSANGKGTQKKAVSREYNGLRDCIRKVKKAEGMRGLYSGFSVAVLGITLYRAMYFGLFDTFKHLWIKVKGNTEASSKEKPPFLVGFLIAQSATCIAGFCAYPLDTVARRFMVESGRPKELRLFKDPWSSFGVLYRRGGILAFYNGAFTNCLRGMSGALVLVFYDEILHYTNWKKWLSECDNC